MHKSLAKRPRPIYPSTGVSFVCVARPEMAKLSAIADSSACEPGGSFKCAEFGKGPYSPYKSPYFWNSKHPVRPGMPRLREPVIERVPTFVMPLVMP